MEMVKPLDAGPMMLFLVFLEQVHQINGHRQLRMCRDTAGLIESKSERHRFFLSKK
jgi:hypothetical protein